MKLQIMCELFNQVNFPYNSGKDVKFISCYIKSVFMAPRHYHISEEVSEKSRFF